MLSEEQKKSKSTNQGEWGCGSLQSMNLGALLVGQLSQAINWSNESSFRKPEFKPWVELRTVSADRKNEEPNSEMPSTAVSAHAVVSNPVSEPTTPEDFADVNNPKRSNAISIDSAQVAIDSTQDTEESTLNDVNVEPEIQSSEQVADLESTAVVSGELTGLPPAIPAEMVAIEVVKEEVEASSTFDESFVELPEESKSQGISDDESKPDPPVTVKSNEESLAVSTSTSDSNRTSQSVTISKVATMEDTIELGAKPLQRPSFQASGRTPSVKVVCKSPGRETPQDDYLLQLERLVVELNMELARVRGEEATVDPIEQMANRIIALNLENLALRERLQQSNPQS